MYEMQIKNLPISDIIPYVNNARIHSADQIDQIAASIREFGFNNPILIDEHKSIIAGHGRLEAAKKLGLKEVSTIKLSHLTKAQKKAYILADNRIALNAGWSPDLLKVEFEALKELDFDIGLTGFTDDEINTYINPEILNEGQCDADECPEVAAEPVTKLGDVWILGDHRLMCGDATNPDNVKSLVQEFNLNIMITDPPYGVNLDQSWRDDALGDKKLGKGNKLKIENDNRADWSEVYSLFTGNIAYVWHASCKTDLVKKNLEDCHLLPRQMIIWNKSIMVMGRSSYHWKHEPCWYAVRKGCDANWKGDRKQTTVWDAVSPNHIRSGSKEDKTEHPSQKPVILFETPILNHTFPTDGVYDPFGGSGTTLIACEKHNRKCLMMEISPHYCDVIVKRWQKFTGKKAILESNGKTFEDVANG